MLFPVRKLVLQECKIVASGRLVVNKPELISAGLSRIRIPPPLHASIINDHFYSAVLSPRRTRKANSSRTIVFVFAGVTPSVSQ